jgi:uncharacterized membrane protein YvbJ
MNYRIHEYFLSRTKIVKLFVRDSQLANKIVKRKQIKMPSCPKCGQLNTDDATYCVNCGASLSSTSQPAVSKPFQSEAPTSNPPSPTASSQITSNVSAGELPQRLEKALRRTELLSYAAIVLAVVILIILIIQIFAP